eukprot:346947-Chlamydomonas_euryale.AAC.2
MGRVREWAECENGPGARKGRVREGAHQPSRLKASHQAVFETASWAGLSLKAGSSLKAGPSLCVCVHAHARAHVRAPSRW